MRKAVLALIAISAAAVPGFSAGFNYSGPAEISAIKISLPAQAAVSAVLAPKHEKNVLPAELPDNPLIVVHTTKFFDEDATAKAGVDATVAAFKAEGRPVIYLVHDQSETGYADFYPADRSPDYELFSAGGENNLPLRADSVTVAGGFFGSYDGARGCHTLAVRDAIRMHFEYSDRPFTVNMPLKAIYFYDEDSGTRDDLLALPKTATAAQLKKVFKDFENLYFLTDTFPTSTPDSMGFGHPFTEQSENPAYRMGEPVDTARYAFELFFNDVKVSKFGQGPRKVSLKLYN